MIQNDEVFEQSEQQLLALLKELAKLKGISQEDIATATGWRQSNVSKILNGAYSPTLKMFLKLAAAIGVTSKEGIDLKKMNRISHRVHNIKNKKVKPNYQEFLILKKHTNDEN
jgi:transcriptional regulator with XRE-family HTH domain